MARTAFKEIGAYDQPQDASYSLLPFNFGRLRDGRYLLTNDLGRFVVIDKPEFEAFVGQALNRDSAVYRDLKASWFLVDDGSSAHTKLLASQYLTRKSFLTGFTKLHIFVVTLRCDHSCPYCQVSRQSTDRLRYDMSAETARRSVELALKSPAPAITIEFQGGEPLLNFDMVRFIVELVEQRNNELGKDISFVVCTNLSTLSQDHLDYCRAHRISISTSLDGPAEIHDRNRPFGRSSSYEVVSKNIRWAQEALGLQQVAALMTTTRFSLAYAREIVDEYLKHDLGSIFLRALSPYGFAVKTWKAIGYTTEQFAEFYKQALSYILELNKRGKTFPEAFATILLRKILTPFPVGYVDLQSPAGAGFGVAVYNYDGDVYASDEARMLAEMHDAALRLGNVHENSYEEIFFGETMQLLATAACNESLAGCAECVFQAYCGADPLYHYATQGDLYGNRALSGFCKRQTAIFQEIFDLVSGADDEIQAVLWSWIREASVAETELPEVEWR